ncbi:T9SS type A sorting domain-containing protein [Larkinella sp. VNQ87]|uniref:T9SS type A sorting domain-containing protein n=1 Tax=Larkinella sp. VNQ87 TaxID=3400921 RepID=UPI003C0AABA6
MKKLFYLIGLVLYLTSTIVLGQCSPPAPTCAGCMPLTADNQNLSSGTFCITTAVSNINIGSGAVVCLSGSGSLINSNLNGGTLIFNGGTLTNFGANSGDLRVFGTLSNPVNTNFNGARVVIESGGVMNVTNFDVNGPLVVNGGTLNTSNLLRINGSGTVCMENLGQIHTTYFQNNSTNSTNAQSTKGCISIAQPQNGQTFLNNSLTNSNNVLVCLPGSFVPSNLGSALVTANCSGCSVAMPVTYAYFRAQPLSQGVRLDWQTASELHHSHFLVERSTNALDFQSISGSVVDPLGTQNGSKVYQFTDRDVQQGTYYYRLKQVDTDGSFDYSKLIAVTLGEQTPALRLYPNPVISVLTLGFESEETGIVDIEVTDASGNLWISQTGNKTAKSHAQTLNLQSLPKGLYLVTVQLGNQFYIRKVLK